MESLYTHIFTSSSIKAQIHPLRVHNRLHGQDHLAKVAAPFQVALGRLRLGQGEGPVDDDPERFLRDQCEDLVQLAEIIGPVLEVPGDGKTGGLAAFRQGGVGVGNGSEGPPDGE